MPIFTLMVCAALVATSGCASLVGGKTYFIDPGAGDDSSSGNSRDAAWRTFAPLERVVLSRGDRVELFPGRYQGTLRPRGGGVPGAPVVIHFHPGRYDFDLTRAFEEKYQITNTNDCPDDPKKVAVLLKRVSNISLEGEGALLVFHRKTMELCVDRSSGISISGLAFDYARPTVSEYRIAAVGNGYLDVEIHRDSRYEIRGGHLYWVGDGWEHTKGLAQELDLDTGIVQRIGTGPVGGASKCVELLPFKVRVYGRPGFLKRFKSGRIYQVRETLRDYSALFIRRSDGVSFKNVHFRFLHGMGVVAQLSRDLSFESVRVAPGEDSGRTVSAWADMLHFADCGGTISIVDCVFSGAQDDALNVHGISLRVAERMGPKRLRIHFAHKETFGFQVFSKGDEVAFIHRSDFGVFATRRVVAASMSSPRDIVLDLDSPLPDDLRSGDVVSNASWAPRVVIKGCDVSHIPTRGFLLGTVRDSVVEGNSFHSTHDSAILLPNDIFSWFETGGVSNILIRNNRFLRCGGSVVLIGPRMASPNPGIYRGVRVVGNVFELRGRLALKVSGTTGLSVEGNVIRAAVPLSAKRAFHISHSRDVEIGGNRFEVVGDGH